MLYTQSKEMRDNGGKRKRESDVFKEQSVNIYVEGRRMCMQCNTT